MSQAVINKLYEIWKRLGDGTAKVDLDGATISADIDRVGIKDATNPAYGLKVGADGAAAVSLTGSKVTLVDDAIAGTTIAAGSFSVFDIVANGNEFKQIEAGLREASSQVFPHKVVLENRLYASGVGIGNVDIIPTQTANTGNGRVECRSNRPRIVYYNNDTVARNVIRYAAGVK